MMAIAAEMKGDHRPGARCSVVVVVFMNDDVGVDADIRRNLYMLLWV